MQRRNFIKQATAGLVSFSIFDPNTEASKKAKKIGIQIYTIRDIMQKDARSGFQAIAAAGYKQLELAGYREGKVYGMPIADLKKLASDEGMRIVSSHVGINLVEYFKNNALPADYLQSLDDAAFLGQTYQVVPALAQAFRGDRENGLRIAEVFNKAGMEARNRNLQFGYHNHAFEFDPIGDSNLMEIILQNTDPNLVKMEMDIYWVVFAKQDPIQWLKRFPGRFDLYHMKDLAATEKRESIEIGDGTIDFNKIIKEGGPAKYYLVEQEAYRTNSLDAMKANYGRISRLKLK
jgi:sugar phosphate isomerase/epimerase